MKKLLREPVLHFAILGVLLFVWFSLSDDNRTVAAQSDEIVISDGGVRRMIEQFNAVWRRNPNEQELVTLVEGAVREEIMVREALVLGLDRGDAAIRNRLKQKMRFLTDSAAQMLEPEDEVLRTYMQDNPDAFSTPELIAFDQVYLGESPSQQEVDSVLAKLAQGEEPQLLGQGGLLPGYMALSTRRQIESTFGAGIFDALKAAEAGKWIGPVRSGYGVHLVRTTDNKPGALAEFASVRDKVLFDWHRTQSYDLAEAQYEIMKARYVVVIPDAAALKQALAQ